MDIGLFLNADGSGADLSIVNGDLALDGTLRTAVLISLLTDRLADPDDKIPDGTANPRGWFGNAYLPTLPDGSNDSIGCKWWLRVRSLATQATLNQLVEDAQHALAWMVLDGVAASVQVIGIWVNETAAQIDIAIAQTGTATNAAPSQFSLLWDRTLGTVSPVISWN